MRDQERARKWAENREKNGVRNENSNCNGESGTDLKDSISNNVGQNSDIPTEAITAVNPCTLVDNSPTVMSAPIHTANALNETCEHQAFGTQRAESTCYSQPKCIPEHCVTLEKNCKSDTKVNGATQHNDIHGNSNTHVHQYNTRRNSHAKLPQHRERYCSDSQIDKYGFVFQRKAGYCRGCKNQVSERFRCVVCNDALCLQCYTKIKSKHKERHEIDSY